PGPVSGVLARYMTVITPVGPQMKVAEGSGWLQALAPWPMRRTEFHRHGPMPSQMRSTYSPRAVPISTGSPLLQWFRSQTPNVYISPGLQNQLALTTLLSVLCGIFQPQSASSPVVPGSQSERTVLTGSSESGPTYSPS